MKELYSFLIIPLVFIQTIWAEGPTGIKFRQDEATKKTGELLNVQCELYPETPGRDGATFQWFDKDNVEITNKNSSHNLYIRKTSDSLHLTWYKIIDDNAGKYKCIATTEGGQNYERTFVLKVEAALVFSNCPEEQTGVFQRNAQIKCTASGGSGPIETYWVKGGIDVDLELARYIVQTGYLEIVNVSKEDAGQYELIADSLNDYKRKSINFRVIVAPQIVTQIQQQTAVVGREASLFCKATGDPLPDIHWFKSGSTNELVNSNRISVVQKDEEVKPGVPGRQGILKFSTVVKSDDGMYECRATNAAQSLQDSTSNKLTVHTPPTVEQVADSEGTEGSSATLRCTARGDPVPEMMWINVNTGIQYAGGTSADGVSVIKTDLPDDNNKGARLELKFTNLKSTDAGEYNCTVKSMAGEDSKSAVLSVAFKPSFDEQPPGPYYTWMGYKEGFIPCVARGNPLPVFTWLLQDGTPINNGLANYAIERIEDEEDRYKVTSKLKVSYTSGNEAHVFQDYTCRAKNKIKEVDLTLTLQEASAPGEPTVSAAENRATEIKFIVQEPTVNGPPVTSFKVTYVKQGSGEKPKELWREKETRSFADNKGSNPPTEILIDELEPRTEYVFTFSAKNAVREGPGRELILKTMALSKPSIVNIVTEPNSQQSQVIRLVWDAPNDGGAVITLYTVRYRRVNVKSVNGTYDPTKGYQLESAINQWTTVEVKDTFKTVANLIPNQYYQFEVYAVNSLGRGLAGVKIIKTKDAPSGGLSTGAIIGIVLAVFFILFVIVDITCYFRNNCGILMSIRERLGASRGEEGYSAAKTDDVENLAKKDELTEEAKAAEEGEAADAIDDEKKEPLLSSEEQKVDTIDEGETKPEEHSTELEPEEKETINTEPAPAAPETPKTEEVVEAPASPPAEGVKPESPATEEQPTPASTDKLQE